ncbi:MAG: hypothetical protein Q9M40_02485 [Sulfurimonas sp.]|nr:hypothetical protein [Sulfurimonas sp.]
MFLEEIEERKEVDESWHKLQSLVELMAVDEVDTVLELVGKVKG